jgi:hypothetical protein
MAGFVPRFSAVVDREGRVRFDNRAAFDTYCATFCTRHVEITIQPWQKKRTRAQLRTWWGLVVEALVEWNGDEPLVWHKRLKREVGLKSAATATTAQMEEARERAIRYAAIEHGVVIPDPHEVSL